MTANTHKPSNPILNILRDVRVLQVIGQVIFAIVLVAVFAQLGNTAATELRALGLTPNYTFLQNRAGFDISESPAWYTPNSNYGDALRVGILNTLRVVSLGLVLATIVGIFFGIFLLSRNWLIRTISRVYVEFLRNTPLLVQLFIWYYIVMFSLPQPREALTLPGEGVFFITLRLALYLVAYVVLRRSLRGLSQNAPPRVMLLTGFFAAAFTTEAAFFLHHNQPGWAGSYGGASLSDNNFLLYLIVSAALILGAFLAPVALRAQAIGASVGQLLGGLLFAIGLMPNAALRSEFYPAIYMSIRGITFPEILATPRITAWLIFVTIGVVLAIALWIYCKQITETTGRAIPRWRYAILTGIGFVVIGWLLVSIAPTPPNVLIEQDGSVRSIPLETALRQNLLSRDERIQYSNQPFVVLLPEQNRLGRFVVGSEISPEYMALLLGLVVYTSAFIAEIVRAGIQAVPRGQVEAARAVGLTQSQTLTLIILPQALRVIIPPLGNQYLNLAKNSSLGIAIGFFETFNTTTTIMNQSGQSITGITLVMAIYLTISLTISVVMNWVNGRFQLVTR